MLLSSTSRLNDTLDPNDPTARTLVVSLMAPLDPGTYQLVLAGNANLSGFEGESPSPSDQVLNTFQVGTGGMAHNRAPGPYLVQLPRTTAPDSSPPGSLGIDSSGTSLANLIPAVDSLVALNLNHDSRTPTRSSSASRFRPCRNRSG